MKNLNEKTQEAKDLINQYKEEGRTTATSKWLSNSSILGWVQKTAVHPLEYYTEERIRDYVKMLEDWHIC